MSKTDLRPYFWHEDNTIFEQWFERDRAMVRLTDMRGNEILCLWDDAVSDFVQDGFKSNHISWHKALTRYATENKMRAQYE